MSMLRISLVTEGKSEHWVIRHIVQKYFKEKEIYFRQIQPQIFNNTQESAGGWLEVLKFCKRTEDIKSALIETDYLIIQIDTDESQNPGFGVLHTKKGSTLKTTEELYNDVVTKIRELIGPELEAEYSSKILFAVCIHSVECWLLPIYYTNNHKASINNCLSVLNRELIKRRSDAIPAKKQKEKRKITYENILRNWKRKQDIVAASKYNIGFKKFMESLKTIEENV